MALTAPSVNVSGDFSPGELAAALYKLNQKKLWDLSPFIMLQQSMFTTTTNTCHSVHFQPTLVLS